MAIEWLHRAWDSSIYTDVPFLYAMGNQPARDLLRDFTFGSHSDICLLGSGDLRHAIKTVGSVLTKRERPKQLNFLVNDINVCIIARNVLLLEAILSCELKNDVELAFIWNIWYNMELSSTDYEKLKQLTSKVLKKLQFAETESVQIWKLTERTRRLLIDVYADWKVRSDDKSTIQQQRHIYINEQSQWFVPRQMLTKRFLCNYTYDQANKKRNEEIDSIVSSEVEAWYKYSSIEMPAGKQPASSSSYINPSMMRPGSSTWSLYYGSIPFDSYFAEIR